MICEDLRPISGICAGNTRHQPPMDKEVSMPMRQVVFALITFFHDLFTVVWIGGLFALGLVVLPLAVGMWGRGPETKRLMDAVQRRLSLLVYVSIVGLAVTGALLARRNPAYGGLFSFANPYSSVLSLKHVLVLLMVAVALLRSVALRDRGRPGGAGQPPRQALVAVGVAKAAMAVGSGGRLG